MACNDPEFFFFNPITAPAEYTRTVTGPAGQFSADSRFFDANSGSAAPLKEPQPLSPSANGDHVVTIILFFVADCKVTVEARCAGQSYCREVSGKANDRVQIVHNLPVS